MNGSKEEEKKYRSVRLRLMCVLTSPTLFAWSFSYWIFSMSLQFVFTHIATSQVQSPYIYICILIWFRLKCRYHIVFFMVNTGHWTVAKSIYFYIKCMGMDNKEEGDHKNWNKCHALFPVIGLMNFILIIFFCVQIMMYILYIYVAYQGAPDRTNQHISTRFTFASTKQ